jgi:hypothetical protein
MSRFSYVQYSTVQYSTAHHLNFLPPALSQPKPQAVRTDTSPESVQNSHTFTVYRLLTSNNTPVDDVIQVRQMAGTAVVLAFGCTVDCIVLTSDRSICGRRAKNFHCRTAANLRGYVLIKY